MTEWLFENRSSVYLVLGTAAVVAAALWWRTRKRREAHGVGAVLALILVFVLLDLFLRGETDREQMERQIQTLAAAVATPTAEKDLAARVSSDFASPRGHKKDAFCKAVAEAARHHQVKEVVVWDFDFQEVSRPTRTARVRFQLKVKGGFDAVAACLVTFRLDPDDQWRILGYRIFFPPNSLDEWPSPF